MEICRSRQEFLTVPHSRAIPLCAGHSLGAFSTCVHTTQRQTLASVPTKPRDCLGGFLYSLCGFSWSFSAGVKIPCRILISSYSTRGIADVLIPANSPRAIKPQTSGSIFSFARNNLSVSSTVSIPISHFNLGQFKSLGYVLFN